MHSTVFEENNGALGLSKPPRTSLRTRHISVKYHFFREKFGENKGIMIHRVESKDQKADIFTKGLPKHSSK